MAAKGHHADDQSMHDPSARFWPANHPHRTRCRRRPGRLSHRRVARLARESLGVQVSAVGECHPQRPGCGGGPLAPAEPRDGRGDCTRPQFRTCRQRSAAWAPSPTGRAPLSPLASPSAGGRHGCPTWGADPSPGRGFAAGCRSGRCDFRPLPEQPLEHITGLAVEARLHRDGVAKLQVRIGRGLVGGPERCRRLRRRRT